MCLMFCVLSKDEVFKMNNTESKKLNEEENRQSNNKEFESFAKVIFEKKVQSMVILLSYKILLENIFDCLLDEK